MKSLAPFSFSSGFSFPGHVLLRLQRPGHDLGRLLMITGYRGLDSWPHVCKKVLVWGHILAPLKSNLRCCAQWGSLVMLPWCQAQTQILDTKITCGGSFVVIERGCVCGEGALPSPSDDLLSAEEGQSPMVRRVELSTVRYPAGPSCSPSTCWVF